MQNYTFRYLYQFVVFQILAHAVTVWAIFNYHWSDWLLAIPFYFLLVGFGISITFHRLCTHQAYSKFPTILKAVGLIFGTVNGQGTSIGWVTKHNQHHSKSDSELDPHSPHFASPYKLYWTNLIHGANIRVKYGITAFKDPMQVWFHKYYWFVNLAYAIVMWAIDTKWLVFGYFVPAAIGWFVTGYGVACASHQRGYINYPNTKDHSRNNILVGLFVFGEGYQNNHHAVPRDCIMSKRWYEFDTLGWLFKVFK